MGLERKKNHFRFYHFYYYLLCFWRIIHKATVQWGYCFIYQIGDDKKKNDTMRVSKKMVKQAWSEETQTEIFKGQFDKV